MKKIYLFLPCIFLCFIASGQISQNSQWTWVKGDSSINKPGNYGTKGVSSTTNKPGARRGGITWKDNDGNLLLYGGSGYAKNSTVGLLNDIWRFSPQTNEWTWIHGADTVNAPGVFGNIGFPGSANTPGGLSNGSPSWKDNNGNLWVMGSSATLWKYSIQTNEWTWVKGDSATSPASANWSKYGMKGVPDINNEPGSAGPLFWTDQNGSFWMYKTFGQTRVGAGSMNDLWKYEPSSNMWTWIDGDSTLRPNGRSVYGTKGVAHDNNYPGQRSQVATWADQNGNLWVFGGYGTAWAPQLNNYTPNFYLSDLWKYSTSINQWTWVRGDSTTGNAGANHLSAYGTQGVPSSINEPGLRGDASGVSDAFGNLWLFHGWGSSANAFTEMMNDLWRYNISTNQWTWMKGDTTGNKLGRYGTLGVAGNTNNPGGRWDLSTWSDGNIWVFGGQGYGTGASDLLNDLWKLSDVYTFIGNGDWNIPSNWISNNVPPNTITGNMTVIINPQPGGECTYNGNITIQQGGTLTIQSGKINITGNLTNAGFLNGTGTVNFTGATPTAFSSSGVITTPISLTGKKIYLTGNTSTNAITLTGNSTIRLDNYNLNMASFALSGYNNQNFIITNGQGRLKRTVDTTMVVFPVGTDSVSYTPLTISFATGARTANANSNANVGDFNVLVRPGVQFGTPGVTLTRGVVNRTWLISHNLDTSARFRLSAEWTAGLEQPDFDRTNSFIAQVCPPPDNCITGFDITAPSAALGSDPYIQSRTGPFQSTSSSFIIRSAPVMFEFTGSVDGNWNNALNWRGGIIPSPIIENSVEVIISNDCSFNGSVIVRPTGKLIVKTEKILNVTGGIILQ